MRARERAALSQSPVWMRAFVLVCDMGVYICTYIYIYTYIHIYIHTCIYIHTIYEYVQYENRYRRIR